MLKNNESLLSLRIYSKNLNKSDYFFDRIKALIKSTNLKIHDYTFDDKFLDQRLLKEKTLNKLEELGALEKIIKPSVCTLILKKY